MAWELAQFNLARAIAPLDSPALAGFMAELQRINQLADDSPGFVWRFEGASAAVPAAAAPGDPQMLYNLSVWRSVEALFDYTYRSDHAKQMARRRQWFEHSREPQLVLFWVAEGHRPSLEEGVERLRELRARGPSPRAFTFKSRVAPPSSQECAQAMPPTR